MTRILADLPDEDIRWLDHLAEQQGKSRASILREAVSAYKAETASDSGLAWLEEGFGAWKQRTDIGDAVEWQRRERASWTRPWDDDYETTKAEFPDLFDAEDDRQRQIYLDMVAGKYPRTRPSDQQ
jgi:predicted transcriptional regulator